MSCTAILPRIRQAKPYLNDALRRIADHALKNPSEFKSSSIKDVAKACDVSESTVTRFVRALEIENFQTLKINIAEELSEKAARGRPHESERAVYEDIGPSDGTADIVDKISSLYVETVNETRRLVSQEAIDQAVDAIDQASMLAFFGIGSSVPAIDNALVRFLRVGKACQFFADFSINQIATGTLGPGTLAIGISNSGRTIVVVDALRRAKAAGARTLCITSFPDSPLAQVADIRLFSPAVTAPLGPAEYHESILSKIAQLQIIDILYSGFAVRHYERSVRMLEDSSVFTRNTRYGSGES